MHFLHNRFLVISLGALVVLVSFGARAQDAFESAAEQELGGVEDATLDGSGEEAADAVNKAVAEGANASNLEPSKAMPSTSDEKPVAPEAPLSETAAKAVEPEKESAAQEEDDVTEPEAPQTPVVNSKPESAKSENVFVIEDSKVKGTYGGRVFGRYKVQIAANKPAFNEGQKCYEKLYGKPQSHISMSGDWFPADWWVNPGLMMRLGMYSTKGKAVKDSSSGSQSVDCDSMVADENSSTSLLFIPLQLGLKVQMSPFRKKWLVLDFWTAGEYGWWQETRENTTAMIKPLNLMATDQVYTNTGRKSAVSTGMSAHILLNPLEERTVRSMINTMGIGYVYLTAFMENVKSPTTTGLSFGRNVLGIGFTFETVK